MNRPGSAQSTRDVHLSGTLILVVDDDDDSRELLATILELAGADVLQASSVAAAMQYIETFQFGALVSDIGMPVEDGYELIRRVRGSSAWLNEMPAVALTAFCTDRDKEKARSAGFQEHLGKPIDVQLLLKTLWRLIREPGA